MSWNQTSRIYKFEVKYHSCKGVQVNTPSLYKTTVLSIMKDSYSTNLVTNQLQVVRKALNW